MTCCQCHNPEPGGDAHSTCHCLALTSPVPPSLPSPQIAKEQVADPECRSVANMAYSTLVRVSEESAEAQEDRAKVVKNSDSNVSVRGARPL